MPVRCVLDCDPGHDDAIAIIAAVAAPQLDLRAITTVAGNGTLQQTTVNARKVVVADRCRRPGRRRRGDAAARRADHGP